MKQINMKKQGLENLMLGLMILIVLLMGAGLFFSCSTPKHFQVEELPEEKRFIEDLAK